MADKLKIPNVLLLIIVGIVLNILTRGANKELYFPPVFLTGIAILALVMITFEGSSKFKWREINTVSTKVLKLVLVFIFLNAVFLTLTTFFIFRFTSDSIFYEIGLALIFAFINSGTDPGAVLIMLREGREKISKVLRIESVINTPFVVLLPFIIIELMESVWTEEIISTLIEQFLPFIQQFVSGIGAGVLIGIIFFKFMRRRYSQRLSPLGVVTAALLTYTIAENLGGSGVLAVSTLGLFFGNVVVKKKEQLREFSEVFTNALEILVFVFIGFIIEIPFTFDFFFRSFVLFLLYLCIRFAAIHITFKSEYNFREKLFMTLNVSKGIAVATIAFALTTLYVEKSSVLYNLSGVIPLLNLTLVFMLYSIILSTIVVKYTNLFVQKSDAVAVTPAKVDKPKKKG